jgi:hypothetical protein
VPASIENLRRVTEELDALLREYGWSVEQETSALKFFAAPPDLGIHGKYTLGLPQDPARSGSDIILREAVNSLSALYGSRINEFYNKLALTTERDGAPSILGARFVDNSTETGSIALASIAAFLKSIEKGLYYEVKFKLGAGRGLRATAEDFTKACRFLQTARGSFVARVEVPQQTLREDLFAEPVVSAQVCTSMFSAIQFINDEILQSDAPFESESLLEQAIALFNPELLESLAALVIEPKVQSIVFSLDVAGQVRTSSTGLVTKERADRLSRYVRFIKNHSRSLRNLEVTGTIVALYSRDPQGNRSHISLQGDVAGERTLITATLTNEQYHSALEAHKNSTQVTLKGHGMRLKTHIRLDRLLQFEV